MAADERDLRLQADSAVVHGAGVERDETEPAALVETAEADARALSLVRAPARPLSLIVNESGVEAWPGPSSRAARVGIPSGAPNQL